MSEPEQNQPLEVAQLSKTGRYLVLGAAFLGWMFAGVQMAVTSLAMKSAVIDLMGTDEKGVVGIWVGYCFCAFLLGAAAGGFVFGWIGDRVGRAKALAFSILMYSVFSGLTFFVEDARLLIVIRFVTCMGVGGVWPSSWIA